MHSSNLIFDIPLFPNRTKKNTKQIIPFSKHNHKRKRDPAAKRHENMTDMHPINFSHKDMNVEDVATSTHAYIHRLLDSRKSWHIHTFTS